MEQRTKITIAVVGGLIGAFLLGGIAFAVTGPVLRGVGAAVLGAPRFEARDGVDEYCIGPQGRWGGGSDSLERGVGEMGRLGRGGPPGDLQSPRDLGSDLPPRLQSAPWGGECPNCGEELQGPRGRWAPPAPESPGT